MDASSMIAAGEPGVTRRSGTTFTFWALLAVYTAARVLQVFHSRIPMLAVVALHVFPPLIFALVHGVSHYGRRGILVFFGLCFTVGNIFEGLGVSTGFPFGSYYFTDVMGPRLFHVPILLGMAYVGMGYLAWTVGRVLVGRRSESFRGADLFIVPFLSTFIMVAWDLSMDPVWSTLVHAWIWRKGGAYFGVPVTNFLGWFLTIYVIYQLFAVYLRGRTSAAIANCNQDCEMALLFYGISAAGNLLLAIPAPGPSVVLDAAGTQWKVSDITVTSALVSIFTMGFYTLLAWMSMKVKLR